MRDKIIALGLLTSVVPETLPGILIAALISWLFLSGQAEAVIPNPNNAKIKECLQETGDSFETFKQLFTVLYCLSDNDSMIFKLSLPLDNRPILNLIYLSYYHFKNFIIYKPIQEGYTKDFYIIGKKYRKIDEQLMENMLNILTEIDNNQLDFEDLDLFNDIYPEVYGIQLERINRTLVNKYVGFIDKQIFYYDNYKYINKKIKELSEDYIKEKNLEWLHRYKIKKIKPHN